MRILLTIALILPALSLADVYRKVEKDGTIVYTTTPPEKGAKPAKLPELGKWKIPELKVSSASCASHGGINCSIGPDIDGSVLCVDNFRDSTERFKFSCTAAKLNIIEISKVDEKGEFTVVIRNSKAVAASEPTVTFKPDKWDKEIKLDGPSTIEPFGVAEFHYKPDKLDQNLKPTLATLNASCANCG